MKIPVVIHRWFEAGASWAFHPEVTPELRRRIISQMGKETKGAEGPIGPVQLDGSPPYIVVGLRAEEASLSAGERSKPILRLALVPGQPAGDDDIRSIRESLSALSPAKPGTDATLLLDWEGNVAPFPKSDVVPSPSASDERRTRPVGLIAVAVIVAAVLLGLAGYLGPRYFSSKDGVAESTSREGGPIANTTESTHREDEKHHPPVATVRPTLEHVKAATTVGDFRRRWDEWKRKLPDPESITAEERAEAAHVFWRLYRADADRQAEAERAARETDAAKSFAAIEAIHNTAFSDYAALMRALQPQASQDAIDARVIHEKERAKFEFAKAIVGAGRYEVAGPFLQKCLKHVAETYEGKPTARDYTDRFAKLLAENDRLRLPKPRTGGFLLVVTGLRDHSKSRDMLRWLPDREPNTRETNIRLRSLDGRVRLALGSVEPAEDDPVARVEGDALTFVVKSVRRNQFLGDRVPFSIHVTDTAKNSVLRSRMRTWSEWRTVEGGPAGPDAVHVIPLAATNSEGRSVSVAEIDLLCPREGPLQEIDFPEPGPAK